MENVFLGLSNPIRDLTGFEKPADYFVYREAMTDPNAFTVPPLLSKIYTVLCSARNQLAELGGQMS